MGLGRLFGCASGKTAWQAFRAMPKWKQVVYPAGALSIFGVGTWGFAQRAKNGKEGRNHPAYLMTGPGQIEYYSNALFKD